MDPRRTFWKSAAELRVRRGSAADFPELGGNSAAELLKIPPKKSAAEFFGVHSKIPPRNFFRQRNSSKNSASGLKSAADFSPRIPLVESDILVESAGGIFRWNLLANLKFKFISRVHWRSPLLNSLSVLGPRPLKSSGGNLAVVLILCRRRLTDPSWTFNGSLTDPSRTHSGPL